VTSHLVDSDLTIDYLKQRRHVLAFLNPLMEVKALAISVVTYAEVAEGLAGARDPDSERERFRLFLERVDVLTVTLGVADMFAEVRRVLRAQGRLLADMDTWIAATALSHDLMLLSRDDHFDRVAGLKRG
jgi:tRNA(fMet)-specific endonuclease VapC